MPDIKIDPPKQLQLLCQLGLFDSAMVMVGIIIGSGIFVTTGIMAKYIPSAGLLLLAWIVGGRSLLPEHSHMRSLGPPCRKQAGSMSI